MNVALYHAPFGTRSCRRRDSSHDSVVQISRNRLHSAASSKRPHAQAPFLRRSWLSFSTEVRNAAGFSRNRGDSDDSAFSDTRPPYAP